MGLQRLNCIINSIIDAVVAIPNDNIYRNWIRSRIVWVTGKIGMVKCAFVCVYAPVNEKGMKGKMKLEKFWEDLG